MKALKTKVLLMMLPTLAFAQVPVDDDGNAIGSYESQAEVMPIGDDGIPRLSQAELEELVGPIALYPDDLLAIVLPASAYPLQIVEAARFLEALKDDPTLQPDPDWDDSVVALTNYPEVIELLNKDLDWTWRLGEAVVAQQADVVAAVESFRDVAYAAGNLKSDSYQTVASNDGVINITPAVEDVIYVPYYEPSRVVHYQPRPVYYYYPRPRPVYYYPYASNHHFNRGYFWGVTTAFSIGWMSDSLHVYHHSYRGHPYYGRTYWNDGWYRRPSISVYNTSYVNNTTVRVNHSSHGDRWRPNTRRREHVRREGYARAETRAVREGRRSATVNKTHRNQPVSFRERDARVTHRSTSRQTHTSVDRATTNRGAHQQRSPDSNYQASNRQNRQQSQQRTERRSAPQRSERASPPVRTQRQAPVRTERASPPARTQRQAPARTERASPPARTQRQAPARTERASPPARTQRQTPARTERAPARTQQRQTESRRRDNKSSGSNERSGRRSSERRSRDRK